jgi:CRP-like cAMP-binding protein
MDLSTFFEYPTVQVHEASDELRFLGDRDERDWEKLLVHTDSRPFRAGDTVIAAGDMDRALYIVTSGTLAMYLPQRSGGDREFKTFEAPTVLGELCFVSGGPRSTTVMAASDGEMRRLSFDSFEVLAAREPELGRAILLDLARILAQRLRTATDFISEWVS